MFVNMSGFTRLSPVLIKQMLRSAFIRQTTARLHTSCRNRSQKMSDEFQSDPVKYSTSKAKDFHSYETFGPPQRQWPWYQPPIIGFSILIFLAYFTIFREENDLDQAMSLTLYDRIPSLEESQLRQSIHYAASQGKDTSAMQVRLKEIIAEKKAAN